MKALFKSIGRFIDKVEKLCLGGSVVAVILMMLLVTADITGRKLFGMPVPGSVELTEDYLMISLVYLAMSYVYTEGGHVRVTLFRRFIPESMKTPIDVLLSLMGLVFFLIMTVRGWITMIRAIQFGEFSSSVLAYPLAPAYFILALGSALLCYRILETVISPEKIKWEEEI